MKRGTRGALALVLMLGLLPSMAAPSGAAPSQVAARAATPDLIERAHARREISRFRADLYLAYAFTDPAKIPSRLRSDAPWDGTLPLLHLRRRVAAMDAGPRRARLRSILEDEAAPTKCSTNTAPSLEETSSHFLVHHPTSIGGGLSIDDYVTSLETSWAREIDTFGWAAPPLHPGAGGRYHVIVANLSAGLYGFVTNSGTYAGTSGNNPNTSWTESEAVTTCMALNDDYSGFPSTPQDSLDSTTAHEFNHSIQYGYGALTGSNAPDDAFVEGGATWMEDEVFDGANDNVNYLWPDFDQSMGSYIASPYPYWITFRGITERYGTGASGGGEQVMQDFWENVSKGSLRGLNAMNDALVNRGTTVADAFHAYAIAVKFSRACGGSYVLPYCFEEGSSYTAEAGVPPTVQHGGVVGNVGGAFNGSVADNYALNWVGLPAGGTHYDVMLDNTSAGGQLRGTIACDTGSQIRRDELPAVVGAGGSTTRASYDPSGCSSVVAVITNQSQTAADPGFSTLRSYRLQTTVSSTDSTPPTAPELSALRSFETRDLIPLAWTASTDPDSGIASYVLQRRVAPPMGSFGSWQDLTTTASTSSAASRRSGYTYCFRVAALNGAGLASAWSTDRCTAAPFDDRALEATSGWSRGSGVVHYRETITRGSRRGAVLVRSIYAKRVALVAARCSGCGTVKVFFDGDLLKKVSLDATTTQNQSVIPLTQFPTRRAGQLKIKIVSSARATLIDGLGASAN